MNIMAKAVISAGEVVVQAGSTGRKIWVGKASWDSTYNRIRTQLIENGVILVTDKGSEFTKNFAFSSPSAAAAVIFGRAANGRTEWKIQGTKTTYAEWEEMQLSNGKAE
ncbi:MAG: DUF4357 domain-containing protein [Rhodobacteraceae bacterium]|nr:DUF4357 domain-containing protein [Paracoccaceae bacterium]